jgi:hypothetical protein
MGCRGRARATFRKGIQIIEVIEHLDTGETTS